jgi:hypothetical protein
MAENTTERQRRSPIHAAAVWEATPVANATRQRAGDRAEASPHVLASQPGELNDSLARATWATADPWLQLLSEAWTTGARLTLAWLDLCWRLGSDTWTTALEQQARISRDQTELWSQWVRADDQEATTRPRA